MLASLVQVQKNNNILRDFEEEEHLYKRAGALVTLLADWHAPPGKELPELMVDLAQEMANHAFWEQVCDPVQHCQIDVVHDPMHLSHYHDSLWQWCTLLPSMAMYKSLILVGFVAMPVFAKVCPRFMFSHKQFRIHCQQPLHQSLFCLTSTDVVPGRCGPDPSLGG